MSTGLDRMLRAVTEANRVGTRLGLGADKPTSGTKDLLGIECTFYEMDLVGECLFDILDCLKGRLDT